MELMHWETEFFEIVPFNVAVIDREYNILKANSNFEATFGDWEKQKCYQVCKDSNKLCSYCKAKVVFNSGESFYSNETGKDKYGKDYHYVVEFVPIKNEKGEVTHIIEMSSNILKSTSFNSEYNILFENVPTFVAIVDKNHNLIKVNRRFRETFGEFKGRKCYQVYKNKNKQCKNCPTSLTFTDGFEHSSTQTGFNTQGEEVQYIVSSSPLAYDENGVSLAIEMATDISEITKLQSQIIESQEFYSEIIKNSSEGVIAINQNNKVQIFNKAAKKILNWKSRKKPGITQLKETLPHGFFDDTKINNVLTQNEEITLNNFFNKPIMVEFNKLDIVKHREKIGQVAYFRDIRRNKELENENLNLHRYASVGRTIKQLKEVGTSLSESIKNDINELKKISSCLKDENLSNKYDELISKFEKMATYMKGMMGSQEIELDSVKIKNPNDFFNEFIAKYSNDFKKQKISLSLIENKRLSALPVDYNKWHELFPVLIYDFNKLIIKNELGPLKADIIIDELDGETILKFKTDYAFSIDFRNEVLTEMSFVNLYVNISSFGGLLDVINDNGKFTFVIMLDKVKIMDILSQVK